MKYTGCPRMGETVKNIEYSHVVAYQMICKDRKSLQLQGIMNMKEQT